MTEPTLGTIVSGARETRVPDKTLTVDEPEALVTDPVKNEIGTDQVEGQPHKDEVATPGPDEEGGQPDKTGAGFKGQREGLTKRYTEQVAEFQRKLDESNAAWERRFEKLVERLAPRQPEQPQQDAPDWFENPKAALQHELKPILDELRGGQTGQREQVSRMMAEDKFGAEAVNEAYSWLQSRVTREPQAAQWDWQRIMSSPHPYGELVRAYRQSQALSEIGDDPAAYRAKIEADILEKIKAGEMPQAAKANGQGAAATVLPSNLADARNAGARTGPAWAGPPSLQDIFKR